MLDKPDQQAEEFRGALQRYLAGILHQRVSLREWPNTGKLPAFLARGYAYLQAQVAGQPCLFMVAMDEPIATPAEIAKHVALVQRSFHGIVAYAAPRMSSHQRARLIQQGVAFAVPGNQLYLPQLATDLREYYRSRPSSTDDRLTPVAQVILFHHILGRNPELTTPTRLSDALKYSAMSVGRGFDELAESGLAQVVRRGREKHLTFGKKPEELIDAARPYLSDPVRKTHYLPWSARVSKLQISGESALAELTSLAPPFLQTFAVGGQRWKTMRAGSSLPKEVHEHDAAVAAEVWRYDPTILSDTKVVDVLSLYARFWNHPDERVAAAAASLLKRLN